MYAEQRREGGRSSASHLSEASFKSGTGVTLQLTPRPYKVYLGLQNAAAFHLILQD